MNKVLVVGRIESSEFKTFSNQGKEDRCLVLYVRWCEPKGITGQDAEGLVALTLYGQAMHLAEQQLEEGMVIEAECRAVSRRSEKGGCFTECRVWVIRPLVRT